MVYGENVIHGVRHLCAIVLYYDAVMAWWGGGVSKAPYVNGLIKIQDLFH